MLPKANADCSILYFQHSRTAVNIPEVTRAAKRFLLFRIWILVLSPFASGANKIQFALGNFFQTLPQIQGGYVRKPAFLSDLDNICNARRFFFLPRALSHILLMLYSRYGGEESPRQE